MNLVLSFLEQNRRQPYIERLGLSSKLSCAVLTPRFRASQHVLFLVLSDGKTEPVLVAKVPRLNGSHANLAREAENLRAAHELRPGGFDSIPRVVAFEEYRGHAILLETALVGRPVDPRELQRNPGSYCASVTAWLTDLQAAHQFRAGGADWFERLAVEPLCSLEMFPFSAEEARAMERTWELLAPLRGVDLPLVFEHGDLGHPNILKLKEGGVGVVDWELAEPQGLPAYDLFFFLAQTAFTSGKARTLREYVAAFHETFFDRDAWARPYLQEYARRLSLPPDLLSALFILCWTRYVAILLRRLVGSDARQEGIDSGTVAWLRANRYYALWLHTLACVEQLDGWDIPATRSRRCDLVAPNARGEAMRNPCSPSH